MVDNPLAKARGLSLRTGAQTMLCLSHRIGDSRYWFNALHTKLSVAWESIYGMPAMRKFFRRLEIIILVARWFKLFLLFILVQIVKATMMRMTEAVLVGQFITQHIRHMRDYFCWTVGAHNRVTNLSRRLSPGPRFPIRESRLISGWIAN